jgi:hypothetical protein
MACICGHAEEDHIDGRSCTVTTDDGECPCVCYEEDEG